MSRNRGHELVDAIVFTMQDLKALEENVTAEGFEPQENIVLRLNYEGKLDNLISELNTYFKDRGNSK